MCVLYVLYFLCVWVFLFFEFFFTPVWWSHQQTSNKDMPTMFHYTVQPRSHTTHSAVAAAAQWGDDHTISEISSAIVSGGEERIKNKIESNKKYIYRKKQTKQNQKHRWEGTDFGWWPHSPGEAGPHTRVWQSPRSRLPWTHTHLHGTIPFCTSEHLQRAALN